MHRTAQQTAFIDALLSTTANLALVARAGCGKTTTILEAVDEYARKFPQAEITVCCFGKGIQKEIAEKLTLRGHTDWKRVQASTTHSMGMGLVKFAFCPKGKTNFVDNKKVFNLINAKNHPTFSTYGAQIAKLVSLAKGEGFGFFSDVQIGDARAWYAMAAHYDVNDFDDTSDMDKVIEAAQQIYRESLQKTDTIDYADMILFPLVKNLRVKFQRDLIFVDEAQDTSRARRALIKKFVKTGGRIVVVGDDRQAIMGFAGASADALTEFTSELNAITLPLNVTWRCPKAVVKQAQRLVPDIEAATGAPDGEVMHLPAMPEAFNPTDAILCRNVAPLVEQAYALIRQGVACKVEGREIGTGLLRMVDRWSRITTIAAYLTKLEDYEARESQKAVAKGLDAKVEEIKDRCDTLRTICRAVQDKKQHDLDDVRAFINAMFADDVSKAGMLTLCTAHKSKGREWPRVFLLEYSKRCPSPYAKQEWALRQEYNLMYVMITRAQETLVFIG